MASGRSYTTAFKTKAETQGIDEMQKKLQGLQKSLRDNQAEQKSLSKEIKDAEKEIKQIEKAIAKTGTTTEEQRKRLEQLRSTIESDRSSMEALKLQESQLRSQIETTNQQIEAERKALSDLKTSMGDAKTAAGDLTKEVAAIGAAATAAVAGLFAFTKSAAEWADSMNTMRDVTGISTSDLQKFTYAAELVDVSVETITGSLTKLTRNMQTAAGNGKSTAAQAFSELGVAVTDAAGQLRDRQEVFYEVIDALGKIENETQRDAYAMNVFGKTAEQLNPLIKGGAAALKEIGDEAERAGLILSQDTLNGLHAFNDKVDELKAKGTAIKELAAAEMTPALEGLVEVGNELLDEVQQMVKSGELKSIAKELGVAIKSGAEALKNIITFVWKFKEAIAAAVVGMVAFKETTEMAALNAVMNANPIGLVISLVAALTVGLGMLAATTNSSVESTERQNSATQEAVEKIDKYSEALQNLEEQQNKTVSSAEAEAEWIRTLQKGYEELRTKNELTGQEKERLIVLADELSKKLGIATSSIKDQTGAYRSLNEEIDTYIKNLVKQAELSGYEEILKAQAQIVAEINLEAQKAKKIWDEEQRAADLLKEKELEALKAYGKSSKEWQNAANAWASQYDRALDARNAWASWVMKLQEAQGELSETEDAFYSLGGVLDKTAEGVSEVAEKTTDFSKEMDDLQKQSSSLRSEMSSLANSMKQLENGEKLSLNTLLDLIEKYPEYAAELIAARDNADLQRQALEHLFEAKKQEYILTLERAAKVENASNEETALVLENMAKQIEGYQGLGNAMGNVAIAAVVANQIVAAALREQAQNLRESVSSYQQEIELIKSMKIGDFVSGSGSSGGNKTTTKEETKTFEKPYTWDYKGETYTSVYSYKEGEYDAVKDADTSAKAYLGVLDRAKTLGKLTLGEEISNLQSLLKWEKLSADQRYDIRVRLYKAQEQLAKENAEIEKKRDEEAQKRRDEADKALLDRQNLALAAYNKLVNGRIEALEAESDAARKSADEQIQALDDVMNKRKQEQDDAKRQKELDQINAKLRYQQLDEFERRELERRKQDILNEQADVNFERSVEAQKASLSAGADAVQSRNDVAIAGLNASKTQFADRMAYLQGSQTYDQRVANNTKTQNITIVQNGLNGDQVLAKLLKELGA